MRIRLILLLLCANLFLLGLNAQQYDYYDVELLAENEISFPNGQTGGLTAAQFNEIDINRDGTNDLLIFDRDGHVIIPLIYTDGQYDYQPKYKSNFPKLKNWVRIRDVNLDGVEDIFCYNIESPINGAELWMGSDEGGELSFEKIKFNQGDYEILYFELGGSYYNIDISPADIPEFIDVDSDGDIDLLTFNPNDGYVYFFRNTNVEDGESLDYPNFTLDDSCWGKFYESGFNENIFLSQSSNQCYDPFVNDDPKDKHNAHAGSTLSLFDQNGDGLYEVLLGDLTSKHIVYLQNSGNPNNAWMTEKDTIFPSYDITIAFDLFLAAFMIDVDKDGHDDILVSPNNRGGVENTENVWYYKSNGESSNLQFSFQDNNEFVENMFDVGSYSTPTFCDYNQDGLLDILIGTFGYYESGMPPQARLILLENVGTSTEPVFQIEDKDYLEFSEYNEDFFTYAPTLGDLDGDGDEDLLVGTNNGILIYCENTAGEGNKFQFGTPVFDYMGIDVGDNVKPFLVDINRDGLLDIVIGEKNQNKDPFTDNLGNINYFQNVGTSEIAEFDDDETVPPNENTLGDVLVKAPLGASGAATPYFYDTGEDYLMWVGSESGAIHIYSDVVDNITGSFTQITDNIPVVEEGFRTAPAIADIDNDNILEMVVGNARGGLTFYKTDRLTNGMLGSNSVANATEKITVYPNPADDELIIKNVKLGSNYRVVSIHGETIESGNLRDAFLQINDYIPGVYILQIIQDNDKSYYAKFIKI